jgi:hypothetical protein
VLRIPGVFLSRVMVDGYCFDLAQAFAEKAVKSRSFPCKKSAKSLPFAPF